MAFADASRDYQEFLDAEIKVPRKYQEFAFDKSLYFFYALFPEAFETT